MKCFRVCLLIVLFSLTVSLPIRFVQAQEGDCGEVVDDSSGEPQGNCGNVLFELAVSHNDGVRDVYGSETAYGACIGGYYNCSNVLTSPDVIEGTEDMSIDGLGELDESVYVSWVLTNWSVSFTSCNNGHPNDVKETSTDYPYETPEFEVWCV